MSLNILFSVCASLRVLHILAPTVDYLQNYKPTARRVSALMPKNLGAKRAVPF